MQPVKVFTEVEATYGARGYSILQRNWDGTMERRTLLYFRDAEGRVKSCVIGSAGTLREVIF
jgi:hypothetical protein